MSPPPLMGREEEEEEEEEEGQSNVNLLTSSNTMGSVCLNNSELKERNYMGLSDCSSVDSSAPSLSDDESKSKLNLKATELRLGLPGSLSPERDDSDSDHLCLSSSTKFDEKLLFPLCPSIDDHHSSSKNAVLGNKRGFSDAMNELSEGKLLLNSDGNTMLEKAKEVAVAPTMVELEGSNVNGCVNYNDNNNSKSSSPATKAQVVGWPPIRSFRKNSLSSTAKNADEVDGKPVYVKVSMDGAPYLRKVDLKNYSAYVELSSSLEKMFSCFTIGECGCHRGVGREIVNESKLKDMIHGSEYVVTYEDKDGDWMLVGDVPWEMFVETCRRMRIMKSSDAIGLAPRAVEKRAGT